MSNTSNEKTGDNLQITHNLPVMSVGEISLALKKRVEDSFARVRVRGEISGFKKAASGHAYFVLKDADAVLDGVCWRGVFSRLGLACEDGMEVVATGRLTTYPGRSKYQIVVEAMELAGEGALLKLLEERRKKLAGEGLFDAERKKALPFIPEVIGVVTSPTGAVFRDIMHRLADRFPRRVLLWPVLVQGDKAAEQVAGAIRGFNAIEKGGNVPRPDVLIVARGGGSLEDLWPFNEEIVVRAAAESQIPLISAVGHETDTTLIDWAADHRAPTPTAAAERVVPVRMELLAQVQDDGLRLDGGVRRFLGDCGLRLQGLARALPDPERMMGDARQRLDDWAERLANGLSFGIQRRRASLATLAARLPRPNQQITAAQSRLMSETRALSAAFAAALYDGRARFDRAASLLESCSFQRVLERGFVLVRDSSEKPVGSVVELSPGMGISLHFHDGEAAAVVEKKVSGSGQQPKKKKHIKTSPKADPQGRLL
jgi:exodeoxyribonuclease VII large subunit